MELMELLEELVEEILLRIPPDEPAYLIRASLVCKRWFRILSDCNFLGRYRVFHRTPPLLGYLHNFYASPGRIPRFVKTSTAILFSGKEPALGSSCWRAIDSRHGRVLIYTFKPEERLVVWDPVTGDQQHLSVPTLDGPFNDHCYTGAILCAAMDACDHLNCHGGPFIAVFVGDSVDYGISAAVYSSETHVWGASTSVDAARLLSIHEDMQSLLVGGMLYFTLSGGKSILKYNFGAHSLSVIDTPGVVPDNNMVMSKAEDGGLGLITMLDNCVYIWMQQDGTNNDVSPDPRIRWVQHRVIKIDTLPPKHYQASSSREVIGFEEDNHIIFIDRGEQIFMLDLKSMHVRKIGERERCSNAILPYVSFYTPDLAKCRMAPPRRCNDPSST